jgi:DNA-directed RNA polymerase specialized sigma24 family protein
MPSDGSVTRWITALQAGDAAAAQQLWVRYFRRLVGLARTRLQGARQLAADEEDVALSAFDSFFRHAEAGRFPQLADRDSLWRLLVTITARKAGHLLRHEGRQKRGGLAQMPENDEDQLLDEVLSREPDPEFSVQVADEYQRLLRLLGDAELESVALWRMEGYSVEEIADRLQYAPRSIKRKLNVIREKWVKEIGNE